MPIKVGFSLGVDSQRQEQEEKQLLKTLTLQRDKVRTAQRDALRMAGYVGTTMGQVTSGQMTRVYSLTI